MHCIAVIVAIHLVFGSEMPNTKPRYWSWNFIKNILRNSIAGLFIREKKAEKSLSNMCNMCSTSFKNGSWHRECITLNHTNGDMGFRARLVISSILDYCHAMETISYWKSLGKHNWMPNEFFSWIQMCPLFRLAVELTESFIIFEPEKRSLSFSVQILSHPCLYLACL